MGVARGRGTSSVAQVHPPEGAAVDEVGGEAVEVGGRGEAPLRGGWTIGNTGCWGSWMRFPDGVTAAFIVNSSLNTVPSIPTTIGLTLPGCKKFAMQDILFAAHEDALGWTPFQDELGVLGSNLFAPTLVTPKPC